MKIVKYNEDHLLEEEIERKVQKTRGVILNEQGKALLVKYAGILMLPGGKIEEEKTIEALKREILEESGIERIALKEEPFLRIDNYNRNYYDRKLGKHINRLTVTYFYFGETKEKINEEKQILSQNEKSGNFSISFENLSVIRYLIENNKTDDIKRKNFNREMLTVLNEFVSYRRGEDIEYQK